jgi:hypothetical protein
MVPTGRNRPVRDPTRLLLRSYEMLHDSNNNSAIHHATHSARDRIVLRHAT